MKKTRKYYHCQSKRESVYPEAKTITYLPFKISLRIFSMIKAISCTTLLKSDSLKNPFQKTIISESPTMALIYTYTILCLTLNSGKSFHLKTRESKNN